MIELKGLPKYTDSVENMKKAFDPVLERFSLNIKFEVQALNGGALVLRWSGKLTDFPAINTIEKRFKKYPAVNFSKWRTRMVFDFVERGD